MDMQQFFETSLAIAGLILVILGSSTLKKRLLLSVRKGPAAQ